MTLSALTKDFTIYNPSLLIDQGSDPGREAVNARLKSTAGLYCPHCYQRTGVLREVRYRNSEKRRVHFFHPKYEGEGKDCKHFSNESARHLAAKAAIAHSLRSQGLENISLELRLETIDPALTFRKPDILVTYPNGAMEAHEVQVSRIDSVELDRRTQGLKQHGCATVIWYLGKGNYTRENREWCSRNAVRCFKLWFEDEDEAKPRWIEDPGIKPKVEPTRQRGDDRCYVKPQKSVSAPAAPTQPEKPKPPQSSWLPFPIGSTVALKTVPTRKYLVLASKPTDPQDDRSTHLNPPAESQANHYYTLQAIEGTSKAYWWHSQLFICD